MGRKIDRFFDDDIRTKDVSVLINFFFDSDEYQEYCDGLEYYMLAIPKHINEYGKEYAVEPLKEQQEFENLSLNSHLAYLYIRIFKNKHGNDLYTLMDSIEQKFKEYFKDILEELFKKGLITFEIIKRDEVKIKNIGYYSKFFDKTIVE